jgi:hypothetical protein
VWDGWFTRRRGGAEEGPRGWPMCFCDPKTLLSREARLGGVEPDLAALPKLAGQRR